MKADALKLELIQWIINLEDKKTLQTLLALKRSQRKDWYDELSDHDKELIRQGEQEMKERKTVSSEDFWKRYGRTVKR